MLKFFLKILQTQPQFSHIYLSSSREVPRMSLAFMIKAYSSQDCRRIRILSINVMNEKTPKNRHRYCFVEIFLFKTQLFILPRTSRKTYWIGDPFTQVKSAKHMVKSKTKSISRLGAFSNFSKTERSIYNFLKIPA